VEDNFEFQLLLLRAIHRSDLLDVFVQPAELSEQAIDYLLGNKLYSDRERYPLPKLILADVRMPGMSGFELLTWVKQQPALNYIPVVMVSVADDPETISKAYTLGAHAYFVKQLSFKKLIDIIRSATV
jgi:CheY-like chemotaxis protein